jgi:hypothetical protein
MRARHNYYPVSWTIMLTYRPVVGPKTFRTLNCRLLRRSTARNYRFIRGSTARNFRLLRGSTARNFWLLRGSTARIRLLRGSIARTPHVLVLNQVQHPVMDLLLPVHNVNQHDKRSCLTA